MFQTLYLTKVKISLLSHNINISIVANANAARRAQANLNANQNDYANTFGKTRKTCFVFKTTPFQIASYKIFYKLEEGKL